MTNCIHNFELDQDGQLTCSICHATKKNLEEEFWQTQQSFEE